RRSGHARHLVALSQHFAAIPVVVQVVVVAAAVPIVQTALLELCRIPVTARDALSLRGDCRLFASSEGKSVRCAHLDGPVGTERVEANTLAPGDARFALPWASAVATRDAILF